MITEQQQYTIKRLEEFNVAHNKDDIIRWCLKKISQPQRKRKVTFKNSGNKCRVGRKYFFEIIDYLNKETTGLEGS